MKQTLSSSINELTTGFSHEADSFCAIAETAHFRELISRFTNYAEYIKEHNSIFNSRSLIDKLSNGSGIIDTSTQSNELRDILFTAQIAVCCELFRGWQLHFNHISKNGMHDFISGRLEPCHTQGQQAVDVMLNRINNSDAVRTIQILRLLGLITTKSECYTQLSLCAGPGTRDIRGLHVTPEIITSSDAENDGEFINFNNQQHRAKGIILVDKDPSVGPRYKALNTNRRDQIIAINEDAETAINILPELLEERGMGKPNLVAGLRIDHKMVPNIRHFIRLIASSIGPSADLVLTIGAGDTTSEFKGRVETLNGIFNHLKECDLDPVRIILHGSGSYEEQRNNIYFGLGSLATYEILYCKLESKKLT